MALFTDDFGTLASWTLESGSPSGNFSVDASPPAGSPGGGGPAGKIHQDGNYFAISRLDLADGGDPTRTDWLAWAFYIEDLAQITDTFFMFALGWNNDPDTQGSNGVYLVAINSDGTINSNYSSSVPITDGVWHTARLGGRVDDGGVGEEWFYLDDVLIAHTTGIGLPGFMNAGTWGPALYDDVNGNPDATVWVDALTWSPGADPGDPEVTNGGGGTLPIVVCGTGLTIRSYLDGTEVTDIAVAGSWTPRLNAPAQAQIKMPMQEWVDAGVGEAGSKLKMVLTDGVDEEIIFHGLALNTQIDTAKDNGYVVFNAMDPMELWQWRPVRDDDGDLSKPEVILTYQNGPAIMEAVLINTVDSTGRVGPAPGFLPGGPPPTQAEGPIFLDIGTVAGGGASLVGAPVDWPKNIMDLFAELVSTGQLDGVIEPTDPGGGVMGTVHFFNGDYGDDHSGDVLFQYGLGNFTAEQVRWNRDMTNVVNKYQIYGGPRVETATDPAGDQHWCFNITGFDAGLVYPPGGQSVDTSNAEYFGADPDNPLGHRIYASRQAYGVRMRVDIFDGYDEDCIPGFGTPGRDLYRYEWQAFSWIAAQPRDIIHITPRSDVYLGCFHIGDLIWVEAVSAVGGGFAGAQRVFQYTVSWEATPSILTLSEIQVSSDAEVAR